jgi:hypothetical protein
VAVTVIIPVNQEQNLIGEKYYDQNK